MLIKNSENFSWIVIIMQEIKKARGQKGVIESAKWNMQTNKHNI